MKSYIKGFHRPSLFGDEEAGRTIEEACEIAKLLESYGYDMLDCNSGFMIRFTTPWLPHIWKRDII